MKWIKAKKRNSIATVVLSIAVFYISFIVAHNSFIWSLFGSILILCIGFLSVVLEYQIELKNYGIWVKTVIELFFVNLMIFVLAVFPFRDKDILTFLVFSIVYTLAKCLLTSMKSKIDNLG